MTDTATMAHSDLQLDTLKALDRSALLECWRDIIGSSPPKNLSAAFLRKAIAYEIQCAHFKGPLKGVQRALERIAAGKASGRTLARSLKPGTRLMREWNGRSWQVEVIESGLVMDGKVYRSLSAIAKHITGAHWSGPRFFGIDG